MLAFDGAASWVRSIRLWIHSSDLGFLTSMIAMAYPLGIDCAPPRATSAEAYIPIIGGLSNGEALTSAIAIS